MRGKSVVEMPTITEACEQIKKEEESLKVSIPAPLNISSLTGNENKK